MEEGASFRPYFNVKDFMKIIIGKLSDSFYNDNIKNLNEVLKKPDRPYGYLMTKIKSLDFAIPIRTKINHKIGFITRTNTVIDGRGYNSGLDYTKAIIIVNPVTDFQKQAIRLTSWSLTKFAKTKIRLFWNSHSMLMTI